MKAAEAKQLVGRTVEWDTDSLICSRKRGIVEEVKGRNILIDGEWRWLPDLTKQGLRVAEYKP